MPHGDLGTSLLLLGVEHSVVELELLLLLLLLPRQEEALPPLPHPVSHHTFGITCA